MRADLLQLKSAIDEAAQQSTSRLSQVDATIAEYGGILADQSIKAETQHERLEELSTAVADLDELTCALRGWAESFARPILPPVPPAPLRASEIPPEDMQEPARLRTSKVEEAMGS
jgi:hypothetical protein